MANDIKSGIGFIIPAAGVVGFFTSLLMGEYMLSIIIAVLGILIWFIYMLVMESHMPHEMGNMIMLFGVLLSLGIFFGFGITQNMWGGFQFQPEGSIFSLVILFFAILTGLNFRNQQASNFKTESNKGGLTQQDRELVMSALNRSEKLPSTTEDPKVIVVKQEVSEPTKESGNGDKDPSLLQAPSYDPYGMSQNPYFAYPPDYYYDDDDEYDDDEYDDEEYDDEEYDDEEWEDEDDK